VTGRGRDVAGANAQLPVAGTKARKRKRTPLESSSLNEYG
jgi:hypothetical protein